ncbi:hypothetical protein PR202_ga30859 [Eleusine coracana subsp. coracana]|uniref:SAUR family protein n=1 Tax=Eleusine coracana subsp. coracana TaxID=191504 RepID=A0AAV5DPW5_ELECO|nr:hypothetical protein PR202_ga30859 [Eleusine coracana subsp. coracana]
MEFDPQDCQFGGLGGCTFRESFFLRYACGDGQQLLVLFLVLVNAGGKARGCGSCFDLRGWWCSYSIDAVLVTRTNGTARCTWSGLRSRSTASASSPAGKIDVPKGHMAVYVGEARKRFVIPTMCLSHPTFLTLLKRVEDEFGFDNRCGELTIPCAFEGDFANIVSSMDVYHHH